ncbi:MAG: ABC transporter substrate-binding protein [Candidatus Bathyarchaeia archaeon]
MVKSIYKIAVVLVVILVASTAGFVAYNGTFNNSGTNTGKTTITVTDMQNRTMVLNAPVERIILLESSKTEELIALDGNIADKIVGWDKDFENNAGDGYAIFVEKYPQLADIDDVGALDDNTFSVEKAIALKPDVVIMHSWMYVWCEDAVKDALSKLTSAGIPVVFVDFYMEPIANSPKSMLLLGQILGQEDRAQDIVDFYNSHVESVYSRLANISDVKPTVYVEQGLKGPSEYDITEGDEGWGSIVKMAGGNNIAESLLGKSSKALSPEYVIDQSPDIIVITGRHWSNPGSVKMGYTATASDTKSTMDGYIARSGWDTINAVKNHKVYAIYQGYTFSVYSFVELEAFAKWFYPQEFQDINPDATIRQYYEQFMPIDFSGTFIFSYY